MRFSELPLRGAHLIELERLEDERGWFARTYDNQAFEERGIDPPGVQCSVSVNRSAGTLRGMHWQEAPHGEDKLVRCVRGAIFDAIIDLREGSDTFCDWYGVELTPHGGLELLVPKGFAHGFQTLTDDTEVHYQMSYPFTAGSGRGVRFDDPRFGVEWPEPPEGGRIMSERDAAYPDFQP
jgi:dTDP-4-dehydrorhamnose 3,5-epimerase